MKPSPPPPPPLSPQGCVQSFIVSGPVCMVVISSFGHGRSNLIGTRCLFICLQAAVSYHMGGKDFCCLPCIGAWVLRMFSSGEFQTRWVIFNPNCAIQNKAGSSTCMAFQECRGYFPRIAGEYRIGVFLYDTQVFFPK